MSSVNLTRGRKRKKGFNNEPNFKLDQMKFSETLAKFPNSNFSSWSIKNEWVEFSKIYFSSSRPKDKHARVCYNYFRSNEGAFSNHTNSSSSCSTQSSVELPNKDKEREFRNNETTTCLSHNSPCPPLPNKLLNEQTSTPKCNEKEKEIPQFYFPNVTKIENSLFLVNCDDAYVVDRLPGEKKIKGYRDEHNTSGKRDFLVNPLLNENDDHAKKRTSDVLVDEQVLGDSEEIGGSRDGYRKRKFDSVVEPFPSEVSSNEKKDDAYDVFNLETGENMTEEGEIYQEEKNENLSKTPLVQTTENSISKGSSLNKNIKKTLNDEELDTITSKENMEANKYTEFIVPKTTYVTIDKETWQDLYSKRIRNKNGERILPPGWGDSISSCLANKLPYCSLAFKRHKLYTTTSDLAKFWYYCTIAGCNLEGTAILNSCFKINLLNKNTNLRHDKGKPKSFQSRPIKGNNRIILGEKAADMAYPSKLHHRKIQALDENLFQMGNMKDVPRSKSVITQCSYEFRKNKREDDSLITSLILIKNDYINEMKYNNVVPGFIQFLSFDPLTIGLWCEQDIEFFHEMAKKHSMLVDATGSVTTKIHGKEILYFSFLFYNKNVRTEPVPHLEILTDRPSTTPLTYLFSLFLEDEKKRYGYTSHSVPMLCTTDCSWPILKCLVECLNSETLEEYISRSYKITSGNAEEKDLPVKQIKTFLHISLCHSMKSFSRKIDKTFKKKERNFTKFTMSLLANSGNLRDIFETIRSFFAVLLSKSNKSCTTEKLSLQSKMDSIESFKEETFRFTSSVEENLEENFSDSGSKELPVKEEIYLQQSKKSIYYEKCLAIYNQILNEAKSTNNNICDADNDDNNVHYSPIFAEYILNNWCGLLPLWTCLHLKDQGRHGKSNVYIQWSKKLNSLDCVQDPPLTQGIVEFHQKSAKHISMNSKRERLDDVVKNLFLAKKSKSRLYEVAKSRQKPKGCKNSNEKVKDTLSNKIVCEKWKKKKQAEGPGYFQQNWNRTVQKRLEEWEKISIIPWGGKHNISDDLFSNTQTIEMRNTCTIDCLLQILLTFYSLNIDQMQRLFLTDDTLCQKIGEVVQHLLTSDFSTAKYIWLTDICKLSANSNGVIDAFEDDKMISLYPIRSIFSRKYKSSTCSSEHCPLSGNENKYNKVDNTTLHYPDSAAVNLLQQSIREYELGTSKSALISCKGEFDKEPEHDEVLSEKVNDRYINRCSGWQLPVCLTSDSKPPFLLFELSSLFSNHIVDLSMIPKYIYLYNDHYRFGGATSYISARRHYVGYICLNDDKMLFYDGLPSINPVLRPYQKNSVYGELSLLFYFPFEHSEEEQVIDNSSSSSSRKSSSNDTSGKKHKKTDSDISRETNSKTFSSNVSSELKNVNPIQYCSNATEDALLAQAISDLDQLEEKENIYAKAKGKSYRKIPRTRTDLVISIDLSKIKLKTLCTSTTNVTDEQNGEKNKNDKVTEGNQVQFKNNDYVEDDYDKRLKHVRHCMTKTMELVRYRQFDRNIQQVADDPRYIKKMTTYIKNTKSFPTGDGSIKLGIDKDNQTAEILDGNHRLTCAANIGPKACPKYVKVVYQYCYLPNKTSLPSCPNPDQWPTYLCGCDLGFTTFDPTK